MEVSSKFCSRSIFSSTPNSRRSARDGGPMGAVRVSVFGRMVSIFAAGFGRVDAGAVLTAAWELGLVLLFNTGAGLDDIRTENMLAAGLSGRR